MISIKRDGVRMRISRNNEINYLDVVEHDQRTVHTSNGAVVYVSWHRKQKDNRANRDARMSIQSLTHEIQLIGECSEQ